jgi:hypothetical protein
MAQFSGAGGKMVTQNRVHDTSGIHAAAILVTIILPSQAGNRRYFRVKSAAFGPYIQWTL